MQYIIMSIQINGNYASCWYVCRPFPGRHGYSERTRSCNHDDIMKFETPEKAIEFIEGHGMTGKWYVCLHHLPCVD